MKYLVLIILLHFCSNGFAQSKLTANNYIGVLPSILVEPYDTINAVEINMLPFAFEHRFKNDMAIQARPVINYRFYKLQSGISQTGFTILCNKYFSNLFKSKTKIIISAGIFHTYTYNMLDKINTLTLGIEPGIMFLPTKRFSVNLNVQPGINYYPDAFSKKFVSSKNGFKSHFGVIIHFGYNF